MRTKDRGRGPCSGSTLLGFALLLPLIAAAAAAQPPTPAPTSAEIDVVEVDLAGQTLNRVLPFDVPFILTGTLPTGVASLEIRCWTLDTQGGRKHGQPLLLTADDLHRFPDGNCWSGGVLTWRNTLDPSAANPRFRVMAPRLDAEKFYQFKFSFAKQVTEDDAKAFAAKVQGIVDAGLWGDPQSGAELPLTGDLSVPELMAIRDRLVEALRQVTGADRFPESENLFNRDTPFEAIRAEFNRLLRPVRNAQGQIDASITNYDGEIANLVPLLDQVRNDPALRRLRDGLAARAEKEPSVQAHATEVAAALAVTEPPSLLRRDRQSAAALTAFAQGGVPYYSDAVTKLDKLRDLLANRLAGAGGSPEPFLAPLVTSGQLSRDDLKHLVDAGQLTGLVGSTFRALGRAKNLLANDLPGLLSERAQSVANVANAYQTKVLGMVVIAGSTTGSFQTQSNNYISADTGIACAPELSSCAVYVGTNIYFRPVNKAAPLSQFGNFFQSFSRRVSVTLGLTANGIGDGGKTREDLFNTQSLVYGVGARLTNSVRVTVGGLLFKKLSPNPLSTDTKLATTYFFSLSFDVDVAPALKGFGNLFKP